MLQNTNKNNINIIRFLSTTGYVNTSNMTKKTMIGQS